MNKTIFGILVPVSLLLSTWFALSGVSIVLLTAVAVLVLTAVLTRFFGGFGAASISLISIFWLVIFLYFLSGLTDVFVKQLLIPCLWLVTLFALLIQLRLPEFKNRLSCKKVAIYLSTILMPLIWVVVCGFSLSGFGDVGPSWAMSGDSATILTQVRDLIRPGTTEIWDNSVPATAAIASVFMIATHKLDLTQSSLGADVLGFAVAWAFVIALLSWTFSSVLISLVKINKQISTTFLVIVGLLGSLIPFSWLYTGYALTFGFLGAMVVLLVVLLAILVLLQDEISPTVKIGVFAFTASLAFFAWTPFVLVPILFMIFELPSLWKIRKNLFGREVTFACIGLVQFVLVFALQLLPFLISTQKSSVPGGAVLALSGAAVYFRPIVIALLLTVMAVTIFLGLYMSNKKLFISFIAIELVLVALFLYLLAGSGKFDFPWLYYPSKFIWLVILVLLPVGLGSGLLWASQLRTPKLRASGKLVLAILIFAAVFVGLRGLSAWGHVNAGLERPNAFTEVTQIRNESHIDQVPDKFVAQQIFGLETREKLTFLWDSGDAHEDQINFWLLKMWSISDHGPLMLGDYIYGTKSKTVASLCEILLEVQTPANIYSQNLGLEKQITESCPSVQSHVSLYSP